MMTQLLIKRFVKDAENTSDPAVRARYGALSGVVGIVCNLLLFAGKTVVGLFSGSVSITADAINNLSDASSSIVTLGGFLLSRKPADPEHPFGHARYEYLAGLTVAMLILAIGFSLAKSSIEKLIHPTEVLFSGWLVATLAASILVKLWMMRFYGSVAEKIGSDTLLAAASDSRNDVLSTSAVLLSAILSKVTGLQLDGAMGLCVAIFILYSGYGIAKDTISPLLGQNADKELAHAIQEEALAFDPHILGLHDLMVHDYGPGQRFASAHIEIDAKEDVLKMHDILDNLERMFMEKHRIHLTVHYDPIVTDDEELNRMRDFVLDKAHEIDESITIHDFRMVRGAEHDNLVFDMVLPDALRGKECAVKSALDEKIRKEERRYYTVVTFDNAQFNH
ncbi:MAG: cation diffusion facilitator family transporter [Christensenellales bacterium]|jgi:cation diffusion facilitator family transporter